MVVSLTIKRLLSSTVDGSAHLCVYDANHNGDDLTVTISCPLASGCCEKGCCKLPVNFITNSHMNTSSLSEEPISNTSQFNETILLITLTLMIFFFGCISILFIFRKIQHIRHKEHEPDFVYHAYRPPQPKVSKNPPTVILTDYRNMTLE
ncbi:Protein CBG09302 [Caenorhabditis briggsae]|uniref:Protein CBG09302 n=1 Tax=Caenorhabditis briggsae TaxID=6238 RepID=A8X9F0_CAEBR|nr:Protein CBG09302 [Caenorhabditis briggsae]CAP29262.2 Protein CBG09302 [Caenorhabditis briggsae]